MKQASLTVSKLFGKIAETNDGQSSKACQPIKEQLEFSAKVNLVIKLGIVVLRANPVSKKPDL